MHLILKALLPFVILGIFKAISYTLYIGVLIGILVSLGF